MELDIDIRLIFAILNGKVSNAINKKLQKKFNEGELRLAPEQWAILAYLSEKDGVTQQQLCKATYKDKPSMTRLINAMERNSLVVRVINPNDKRANTIYLTRIGRSVKEKAQKIALRTLKESLRGLGTEELTVSQEVLRRIFTNLTNEAV